MKRAGNNAEGLRPDEIFCLGDDVVGIVDKQIRDTTRERRNDVSLGVINHADGGEVENRDWRRLSLSEINKKFKISLDEPRGTGNKINLPERADPLFVVSAALDVLTDWGKLVPDQQAVRKGEGDSGGQPPVYRLDTYSTTLEDGSSEEILIERCFRAGEITAEIQNRTLTGGRISVVAESFTLAGVSRKGHSAHAYPFRDCWAEKKNSVPEDSDPEVEGDYSLKNGTCDNQAQGKQHQVRGESRVRDYFAPDFSNDDDGDRVTWIPSPTGGKQVSHPSVTLRCLLRVLAAVPACICRANSGHRDPDDVKKLKRYIEDARLSYSSLPCPAVTSKKSATEVEYAGELLNYFNSGSRNEDEQDFSVSSDVTKGASGDGVDKSMRPGKTTASDDLKAWRVSGRSVSEFNGEWSFREFRRLKRAYLALDTLLAVLHPLLEDGESSPSSSPGAQKKLPEDLGSLRLIRRHDVFDVYDESELRKEFSNDVWDDWQSRLAGPPVPRRFASRDRLETNCSQEGLAVSFLDLLNDVWHALTHASLVFLSELETPAPFISHRLAIGDVAQEVVRKVLDSLPKRLRKVSGVEKGLRSSGSSKFILTYSPFGAQDSLYTAEQVVGQCWEFRSGGAWARLTESELNHLVNTGRVVEVLDWQGVKRYPSFQFAPVCLREGLFVRREGGLEASGKFGVRFTDEEYPFLRRDVSEAMIGSSRAMTGWVAALWFSSLLRRVGETSDREGEIFSPNLGYRGLLFREALSQKGLWVDAWLADARALLHSDDAMPEYLQSNCARLKPGALRKLYRLSSFGYLHPNMWANAAVFEASLGKLQGYRERTLAERDFLDEPWYPPGRFDPGAHSRNVNGGEYFGAMYLAESISGCVFEVFDRLPSITLDDVVSKRIYRYDVQLPDEFEFVDLRRWPALVSATPIRSITQAIANTLCYGHSLSRKKTSDGYSGLIDKLPRVIRYQLRTALDKCGWVLFEPTFFKGGRLKTIDHVVKLLDCGTTPSDKKAGADTWKNREMLRCDTANHDVGWQPSSQRKDSMVEPWCSPDLSAVLSWSEPGKGVRKFWRAIWRLRVDPRDSVVCLRRFPREGRLGEWAGSSEAVGPVF
ncbi:RES family NAD+ phosphorylase [Arachnia propionica]|uniref:Uncharacterized protein n=1 Tax=Arachnia propionica TaxID=1750 RepID=A0A3P1WWG0_9ACTN|nr:RES family NAD+ phosphorylase [Arachnia propionica]RRD50571.1 hypothetical protein EII35_04030 [Arachnia propionica]